MAANPLPPEAPARRMQFCSPCLRALAASWILAGFALSAAAGAEPAGERILLAQVGVDQVEAPPADGEPEDALGPPPGIEVLRVRGRGLSEIVTDLPSSVTSFDAATIEALGAQDVSDLSRVTPNVSIVQPGATQATFFIRGIGLSDFSSNAAGAVTIFQDDVAINAPAIQTGQLFDIEGVDIVRGPQGTGHFRNASGGAIRVRSTRPTGNYSAQLRASLGQYAADGGKGAHRATIQEYEGHLDVPVVEDLVAARFAFRLRDAEPYMTNGCGGAPPFSERPNLQDARAAGIRNLTRALAFINTCGELGNTYRDRFDPNSGLSTISTIPEGLPRRVGDQANWAARGSLRLTLPETDWDLLLNAHGSRLDQQPTFGQAFGTAELRPSTDAERFGFFGGAVRAIGSGLYWEPDLREEYLGIDSMGGLCRVDAQGSQCTNPAAQAQFARNLSRKRPLDLRPYRGDYDVEGKVTRDAYGSFVSAEGKIGDYDLFVLASYDAYERVEISDIDFTPEELIFQASFDEAWQTYEEVRLGGELRATPFSWELGGFYLYEQLENEVFNRILDGTFRAAEVSREFDFIRDFEQRIHSLGVWASFSWDFLDDLTLEGGVRWNYERKDFDFLVDGIFGAKPQVTSETATWSEPTGELVLTWHIDERAQAYARYTRGFKAGHFNSLATARLDNLLAERETNDAWEAGLRGAFWDGRVRGGGAFFYYLYNDFQVFLFSDAAQQPPTLEIVNASEAELYGVEIEGQLRPLQGWLPAALEDLVLTANFSWLQGQYIDFQTETTFLQGSGFTTVTFDFSGNDLTSAPRYKVSGSAEWTLDLGRFGYVIPRYDFSWTDVQFFDPRQGQGRPNRSGGGSLPELTIAQPALWLHGLRLAYRTPTGNIEVAGWIRNLTDEVYKNFAFDASRFGGVVLNFVGEPRTMGVDLVLTF